MNWQQLAPLYDAQLALERPALRAAVRLAQPRGTDRVLDLGTGTGAFLRELLRVEPHPVEVVGVDSSEHMLARAARDLPGRVRLEQGDARALDLAPESFDLILSAYVLNVVSLADGLAIFAEAERLLAPGGRLVVVSAVAPPSFLARPYRWLWRALGKVWPSLFGSFRLVDPEDCIARNGLEVFGREYVGRGYPSLCVRYRVERKYRDGRVSESRIQDAHPSPLAARSSIVPPTGI